MTWLREADLAAGVQAALALVGVLVLLGTQVPWVDGMLRSAGVEDTTGLGMSAVAVMLLVIYVELRRGARASRRSDGHDGFYEDPRDMYDDMLRRMAMVRKSDHKSIDVLGLTLYSAWPQFSFWLQNEDVSDWSVRAAVLDPDVEVPAVSSAWSVEARGKIEAIERFASRREIVRRRISIDVRTYAFTPGVHGFRLGNGDVYLSVVHWDDDGDVVASEGISYQYVAAADRRPSAEGTRRLFDSWFAQAYGPG